VAQDPRWNAARALDSSLTASPPAQRAALSRLNEVPSVGEIPSFNSNPAARDVWCDTQNHDWRPGGAISFRVKPDHAVKLSVSFIDRNGVAYTAWVKAEQPRAWQTLRISLAEIRPNPYFQPPNAKTGAPLDVSEVTSIGFAPHDDVAGRFEIGGFVVGD
jgi:hypothetical protein